MRICVISNNNPRDLIKLTLHRTQGKNLLQNNRDFIA